MTLEKRKRGRPKNFDVNPSQTKIQSLDRALDVLNALAVEDGMTLTEVSSALDQSPATMYRVLSTLQARNIVEIETETQTWHVGPMAFRLGTAFLRRSNIVERSRQSMRDLMEATGETSNLGIEMKDDVMFVSQVETSETIRAFFPPGTLSPMHASGIGKALLSQLSEDRLERYLRTVPRQRFTDKTLTDDGALREDLEITRTRGWAFDDEEKTEGMRCIAAPIFNMYGETVAGISVSGPTSRMAKDEIEQIGEKVKSAAEKASLGLG